jgi:glutamate/tyrosine decarboxylase-like PLP-dependent enzyme
MPLPHAGLPADAILSELRARKGRDLPWRDGRVFAYVYDAGPSVRDVAHRAFDLYLDENGLDPTAFPSVLQLENEVIGFCRDLLHGGPDVAGSFTSGGTESCLLAAKTARDAARARGVLRPNLVCPVTAHAAFHKACSYFGVELRLVPVGRDFRVAPRDIDARIDDSTALIVVSAPGYTHGVVDPVEEVGALAARRGVLCHVDACIGGFVLAAWRDLGRSVPEFDLQVPGVTSISMDLHKYGFCPKGASVVLYRDAALRQFQFFSTSTWTGYAMVNPTIQSSKSGGPVAAAWAVLRFLGRDGYGELGRIMAEATDRILDGIRAIPDLFLLAEPDTNLVAVGTRGFSPFVLADAMRARGWYLQPQLGAAGSPPNLHLSIGPNAEPHVEGMLADLRDAVAESRNAAPVAPPDFGPLVELLRGPLDDTTFDGLFAAAGVSGSSLPERMAPVTELLNALPEDVRGGLLGRYFGRIFQAT